MAAKEEKRKKVISKIKDGDKQIVDQKEIRESFTNYQKLYQEQKINLNDIKDYLGTIPDVKINKLVIQKFNGLIEIEKIELAINQMNIGKTSGPDGISAKFCKLLKSEISPILKQILNNLLNRGKIPKTWNEAYITLIPKDGQDLLNVKNYCPISLLNDDYKIGAPVLARRLKNFLVDYINDEQTGILPVQQIKDNHRYFFLQC